MIAVNSVKNIDILNVFNEFLMTQEASVTKGRKGVLPKVTQLIHPPATGPWAFNVPSYFNAALDIAYDTSAKNPCWKQGSAFAFSANDIVYDVDLSGVKLWKNCMKFLSMSLRINRSTSAGVVETSSGFLRYAGIVVFDVLTPDANRQKLLKRKEIESSQDDFIRLLITGAMPGEHNDL